MYLLHQNLTNPMQTKFRQIIKIPPKIALKNYPRFNSMFQIRQHHSVPRVDWKQANAIQRSTKSLLISEISVKTRKNSRSINNVRVESIFPRKSPAEAYFASKVKDFDNSRFPATAPNNGVSSFFLHKLVKYNATPKYFKHCSTLQNNFLVSAVPIDNITVVNAKIPSHRRGNNVSILAKNATSQHKYR